ncbi:MAG: undecaprenyl-diphosphate phosphatase [Bacteroidales bacterium]|nr:undecaprenyl-diphosphate phosphatase [Bacteroidales bacterium]
MSWLEALILGIVQGLTEFLPVSSSGHLQIGQALFGIEGEENLMFAVVVHAATVCSTLFVLWQEVAKLFKGLFRFQWNDETQYITKIVISMIPVAFVGVLFKKQIEAVFGSGLLIVGICLLATAALLTFAYYAKPRQKEKLSFRDALIVGLAQACAVLPGLSRSGSTIATGLLLGNKKETIAKFSFLMVLIPIMGEALLDLLKGNFSETSTGIPAFSLVVGFIAAFVAGSLACKWMISIVKKGKLIYFAIYCVVVGLLALGYGLFT